MIPLLAFGAHYPEQVMFQKTLRKPETEHPNDVVWVPEPFTVVDAAAIWGWSNAARINMQILRRLLTVRTEWSRK